jgi:hypothetical protein
MCASVRLGWRCAVLATVVVTAAATFAADASKGIGAFDPKYPTVELFPAIKAGQLDVRLIPNDSTRCKLLITNKSDQPLNVKLPEVMAAVPALAQMGLPMAPLDNRSSNRKPKDRAPQTLAVPFANPFQNVNNNNNNNQNPLMNINNNNNRNNGPNNRNPFMPFSIAPERVGQFRLPAVCLEHGKPEPRSAVPYQLKPIESVTGKPELVEVCRMLGHDEIGQKVAQAAAWHLANDMSWDDLAHKQLKLIGAPLTSCFSKKEIAAAKEAVGKAADAVKRAQPPTSSSAAR